jgi:hypothetical protein
MPKNLLMYNKNQDTLDRDSVALSTKKEEGEDLIFDDNYNEANSSSQCIIDECSDLGVNLIAITDDSENYFPYFVCDMHYHELMTEYYSKKNNNNALAIISQTQ